MLGDLIELKDPKRIYNPALRGVWVIGDVHGCADQFEQLLYMIRSEDPTGLIFQLGDLIDRGPDLLRPFQLADRFGVFTCIGNHELNFIQEHFEYKQCRSKARMATHQKLKSLTDQESRFVIDRMLQMSNYYDVTLSNGEVWTLSHAPIKKSYQRKEDCGNAGTFCMGNEAYTHDDTLCAHGHMHWDYINIDDQIANGSLTFNVDSGCCYGGELIAVELATKQVLRVPGVKYAT